MKAKPTTSKTICSGRCSTELFEFGVSGSCVVVKPLECKRGIASKLNGQLEFTVDIENASDADQRQYELQKQVSPVIVSYNYGKKSTWMFGHRIVP